MGRADGNGPRHPEMVSYADAALPAAGTPLAGTRGNPPRALASCRTGMGTGCSARNEGTARPAGNPDHLDAGAHEHEHAPTRRTQRARPRRTAGAAPSSTRSCTTATTPTTIWGKTGIRICSPRTTSRPFPTAASTCGAAGTGSISPYGRVRGKTRSLRWDGSHTNMSRGNTGPYINKCRPALIRTLAPDRREKHGQRTHPETEQRRVHPARTDDRHRHSGDSRGHRRPEIHGRAHKARVVQAKMQIENLSTAVKNSISTTGSTRPRNRASKRSSPVRPSARRPRTTRPTATSPRS